LAVPYSFIRPALFCFEAEQAHHLTLSALKLGQRLGLLTPKSNGTETGTCSVMGLNFPNKVGLAAGLDKNGAYIDALAALGFGFIEIGTVTPRPQAGNPKPRLFRLPEHQAIINRMGFNNDGVEALVKNVAASQYKGILGINIGKNASTPIHQATDDYVTCLKAVYNQASYVTINISSPNTQNLRTLQTGDALVDLLVALKAQQAALADQFGRYVPLAVKIAPDLSDTEIDIMAKLFIHHKIDGVIATNTTLSRSAIIGHALANEAGGLSGAPVTELSNQVIKKLAAQLDGALPIIGAGGILSGNDAKNKLAAGANLVQVYSGLIYQGPSLIAECIQATR
jgi:dihydroorotate dehydrogenase